MPSTIAASRLLLLTLPVLLRSRRRSPIPLLLLLWRVLLLRVMRGVDPLLRRTSGRRGGTLLVEARVEVTSLDGNGTCGRVGLWAVGVELRLRVVVVLWRVVLRVVLLLRCVGRSWTVALPVVGGIGWLLLGWRRSTDELRRRSVATESEGRRCGTRRRGLRRRRDRTAKLRRRGGHAKGDSSRWRRRRHG